MAILCKVTDDLYSPTNMDELPEDLKSKLMLIDCELLYGKDDWWMSEVLFTPSEFHLDFLQWILTNFNESLEKYFQQPQSSLDSPHEVQAQRILKLCSNLGLCEAKDENLIKGKAPYGQLLRFWQHLLDIFLIKTQRHKKQAIRFPKENSSFEEQIAMDNQILNSDCERNFYGNKAFKVSPNLIPTDLYRRINLQNEIPNGDILSNNLTSIKFSCARQRKLIDEMQERSPYDILANRDSVSTNLTEQNINLVLCDLEKMAVQFTQCHEDLKPWLKSKSQTKFSSLGQKFQEACDKLEEFTNALNQITDLKTSYNALEKSLENEADTFAIKDYLGPVQDLLT